MGNRRARALCAHALGAVKYLLGEWQEGSAALQQSIELNRSFGGTFGEVLGLQQLALLETGLGRYAEAYRRLLDALTIARASDNAVVRMHSMTRLFGTLARNRLEAGDVPSATDYLAQGFAAQQEAGECLSCDVLLYPAAVPIYLALGDLAQAEYACGKAEAAATAFRSRAWIATARYLRGWLAVAHAEWSLAANCFQDALDMFVALQQPYDTARSLDGLATVAAQAVATLSHLDPEALQRRATGIYATLGAQRRTHHRNDR